MYTSLHQVGDIISWWLPAKQMTAPLDTFYCGLAQPLLRLSIPVHLIFPHLLDLEQKAWRLIWLHWHEMGSKVLDLHLTFPICKMEELPIPFTRGY